MGKTPSGTGKALPGAGMTIHDRLESGVRSYCRSFDAVFARASGSTLFADDGRAYIDFLAAAGAINYGHNDPAIKDAVRAALDADYLLAGLDLITPQKSAFMSRFEETILTPRHLTYKLMFPGPTGTNSVEAALKIARKATARRLIVGFEGGFHGMTLGALAASGLEFPRSGAGLPLTDTLILPFQAPDAAERLAAFPPGEQPAAVVLETVQGEGGIRPVADDWLRDLAAACRRHDVVLIVDDVQMGCGRTGPFFSFEHAGIKPDIVCLAKSIGGLGLPMALLLIRPDLDVFRPGEHNGTFRGNTLAFIAATAALQLYWTSDSLAETVTRKGALIGHHLADLCSALPDNRRAEPRGRGMARGLVFADPDIAAAARAACFERGLIAETAGPSDEVLKVFPPLTIDDQTLQRGLDIVSEAVDAVVH